MVRTSLPEIGAEHMLQSLTAGCGRKRQLTGVGSKTAIAALLPLVASTRTSTQVDPGRSETATRRPWSLSARITGAPRIRRPQTSAYSKHADACDSRVAGRVILRSRINPSEGKSRQIGRKYYPPFWSRSLPGAAFRAMTGRTVNPQVPGSSPGRGANIHAGFGRSALRVGNISLPLG